MDAITIQTKSNNKHGTLKLVLGPMFSGKTTELIRDIRLLKIIQKTALVIKPLIDNRYSNDMIASHNLEKEKSVCSSNLETLDILVKEYDTVIIDEGHFFPDLKKYVLKWVNEYGIHIIVGGLDGDYKREPIGQILELIPHCDNFMKFNSLCKMCNDGTPAIFTHRKIASQEQVLVGGSETYEPLCRTHYNELN
jgi:thymidine kinase